MLEDLIFPPETPDLPPLRLGTVHIKKLVVSVPWGRWTTGFLDVQLDGLTVNMYRRPVETMTVQDLRNRREACVARLMEEMIE